MKYNTCSASFLPYLCLGWIGGIVGRQIVDSEIIFHNCLPWNLLVAFCSGIIFCSRYIFLLPSILQEQKHFLFLVILECHEASRCLTRFLRILYFFSFFCDSC